MRGRVYRLKLHKADREVERSLSFALHSAFEAVPFWRERLGGLHRFPESLSEWPITTKEELVAAGVAARTHRQVNPRRCARTSTSGFSGMPVTVLLSRAEAAFRKLVLLRTLRRYAPLTLPLRIVDVGPMVPHADRPLEQRLGLVSIHRLPGDLPLGRQVAALASSRPQLLEGYPTCLGLLAEALREGQPSMIRPRLVVCRGEALHEKVRRLLAEVFDAPIANLYSCEEVGNLAWECPRAPGRFHINRDACLIEAVDDGGRPVHGTVGRLLVTSLYGRTMPFIRLELGDRGALIGTPNDRCGCGERGPFLVELSGKDDDDVILADGRHLSPRILTNAVFNALRSPRAAHDISQAVHRYQIVQVAPDRVEVAIVWNGEPDAAIAGRIVREIERSAPDLHSVCRSVAAVRLLPSGKFKKVIRTFRPQRRTPS